VGEGYVVSGAGPDGAFHTEPQPDASDAYAEALLVVLPARGPAAGDAAGALTR